MHSNPTPNFVPFSAPVSAFSAAGGVSSATTASASAPTIGAAGRGGGSQPTGPPPQQRQQHMQYHANHEQHASAARIIAGSVTANGYPASGTASSLQPTISLGNTQTMYLTIVFHAAGEVRCGPSTQLPVPLATFTANAIHRTNPTDAPSITGGAAPAVTRSLDSAAAPSTATHANTATDRHDLALGGLASQIPSFGFGPDASATDTTTNRIDDEVAKSELRRLLDIESSLSVLTSRLAITRRSGSFRPAGRSLLALLSHETNDYFSRLDARPLLRAASPSATASLATCTSAPITQSGMTRSTSPARSHTESPFFTTGSPHETAELLAAPFDWPITSLTDTDTRPDQTRTTNDTRHSSSWSTPTDNNPNYGDGDDLKGLQ